MSRLLNRESKWIPVILIVLLISCWIELDLYAPSFPQIMHYFNTTEESIQLTLSLNFIGFFFASLLCGPLADSYGRRLVLLAGSAIFILGSIICLFSLSMEMLLLGRLIQGIGVSAPTTIAMAVIFDIYQGERQLRLLSRMNSTVTITMALAPVAGVFLSEAYGWHSTFALILVLAFLGTALMYFFVPETHATHLRTTFKPKELINGYWKLLTSGNFMMTTLGLCFCVTSYFVFIGIVPLLFMEALHVPINEYAFYQGAVVGVYALLSLGMGLLMRHFDLAKMAFWSLLLNFISTTLLLIVGFTLPDNPLIITLLMCGVAGGMVVPTTVLFGNAMEVFPELRACASSLIQSMRMLVMALATAIAGVVYDGEFWPIGILIFALTALSTPMMFYSLRGYKQPSLAMANSH